MYHHSSRYTTPTYSIVKGSFWNKRPKVSGGLFVDELPGSFNSINPYCYIR
jgi:hypothetical protein